MPSSQSDDEEESMLSEAIPEVLGQQVEPSRASETSGELQNPPKSSERIQQEASETDRVEPESDGFGPGTFEATFAENTVGADSDSSDSSSSSESSSESASEIFEAFAKKTANKTVETPDLFKIRGGKYHLRSSKSSSHFKCGVFISRNAEHRPGAHFMNPKCARCFKIDRRL